MAIENDIVLIYFENDPVTFARVEDIRADSKPGWYQIKLLFLQLPLQTVTWILREAYINGETFTMNGKPIRLEKVVSPDPPQTAGKLAPKQEKIKPPAGDDGQKVIFLADKKK
jgi:hypothetical protein